MIMRMYVFFDRVSQQSLPQVLMFPNQDVCLRGMKHLVNDNRFPHKDIVDDLQLFYIGDYDVESMSISPVKEFVVNLSDLIFKEVGNGKV